jgi:Eph receptor B1
VYFQVIINTEVRSIPVTKKGVYFAFRDQGACISLLAIRVYYITCPEVTASFAAFPATPTGRELTSIEQSNGVCVANAVEDAPPKYLCKGDGNWYLQGGGCLCKPGYEANADKQTCNGIIIIIIMHFHPPLQQQQLPLFLSSSSSSPSFH